MPDDQILTMAIAELQARATTNLRAAQGHSDLVRDAILSYLLEGYRLGLCPSELTDFFCISTPNIVEGAGYVDAAGDAIVALFDDIHDQFQPTTGA